MIDTTAGADPQVRLPEPQRVLDEWSMRLLELGVAGLALAAALLLTVAR